MSESKRATVDREKFNIRRIQITSASPRAWSKPFRAAILSCCGCGLAHEIKVLDDKTLTMRVHKGLTGHNRKTRKYSMVPRS